MVVITIGEKAGEGNTPSSNGQILRRGSAALRVAVLLKPECYFESGSAALACQLQNKICYIG
jgi:hypothetical protein